MLFRSPVVTRVCLVQDVKQELMRMMEQAGFSSSRSRTSPAQGPPGQQQISLLKAVVTAGLYDSVGRVLVTPAVDVLERVVCTAETPQGRAQVHPSSVNRHLHTHGWLLYQEKVGVGLREEGFPMLKRPTIPVSLDIPERPLLSPLPPVCVCVCVCALQVKYSRIYLRDTTLISPFPMLLFGGDIDVQHRERLISLDGWIHFQVGQRVTASWIGQGWMEGREGGQIGALEHDEDVVVC